MKEDYENINDYLYAILILNAFINGVFWQLIFFIIHWPKNFCKKQINTRAILKTDSIERNFNSIEE